MRPFVRAWREAWLWSQMISHCCPSKVGHYVLQWTDRGLCTHHMGNILHSGDVGQRSHVVHALWLSRWAKEVMSNHPSFTTRKVSSNHCLYHAILRHYTVFQRVRTYYHCALCSGHPPQAKKDALWHEVSQRHADAIRECDDTEHNDSIPCLRLSLTKSSPWQPPNRSQPCVYMRSSWSTQQRRLPRATKCCPGGNSPWGTQFHGSGLPDVSPQTRNNACYAPREWPWTGCCDQQWWWV